MQSACRRPDKSDKMFTDKDIAAMRWIADKREAKEGGRPAPAASPAAKSPDQKQLESIIDRATEDSEAFQVGQSMLLNLVISMKDGLWGHNDHAAAHLGNHLLQRAALAEHVSENCHQHE